MAQSLLRASPDDGSHIKSAPQEFCSEENIANMLRKIGIVAACIDLHHWRYVIDQVLREMEAERREQLADQLEMPSGSIPAAKSYPEKRYSAYVGFCGT